jgi:hypothetical protein
VSKANAAKLLAELQRRKASVDPYWLKPALSAKQLEVIASPHRFKVLRCGRRAGKTFLISYKMILTCLARRNASVLYIGLTRESAKEIIWEPLKQTLDENHIKYTPYESSLKIVLENGAYIRVVGADLQKAQARLRGLAWDLVVVDECGFTDTADTLIHTVLPSVSDHGGAIWMASSPGEPRGFFYEADQDPKKSQHWEHHTWDMRHNPFYGEERALAEMKLACDLKYGGDWNHPLFRQEYHAEWCYDNSAFLYHYNSEKNVVPRKTDIYARECWDVPKDLTESVIGIDFGYNDKCVIRVGQYSEYDKTFYSLDYWEMVGALTHDVANALVPLMEKYHPRIIVGDFGGLGKPYAEGLRQLYGLPIVPAQKTEKAAAIRLFNSAMWAGWVKVKPEDPVITEWEKILKDEDTGIEKEGCQCDHSDAMLYAWRSSGAYAASMRPVELSEEERMFNNVLSKNENKIESEEYHDGRWDSY